MLLHYKIIFNRKKCHENNTFPIFLLKHPCLITYNILSDFRFLDLFTYGLSSFQQNKLLQQLWGVQFSLFDLYLVLDFKECNRISENRHNFTMGRQIHLQLKMIVLGQTDTLLLKWYKARQRNVNWTKTQIQQTRKTRPSKNRFFECERAFNSFYRRIQITALLEMNIAGNCISSTILIYKKNIR